MISQEEKIWLEERKKGVGGSDIAAIMGLSPWKTSYRLYQEKRDEVIPDPSEDLQAIFDWGKLVEPSLRQFYSNKTGRVVKCPGPYEILHHKDFPFLTATLDGFTDDGRIVECKTARHPNGWGEPGTAEVPEAYGLQVQHYMLVTGFKVADVVVTIGGAPPVMYELPADEEIHQLIIDAAKDFWARVQEGRPPEPISFNDAVARFGLSNSEGIVYAPEEDVATVGQLRALSKEKAELEEKEQDLKGKLIITLGDKGDTLVDSTGLVLCTYKLSKGRATIDTKALQVHEPEIYAKFLKIGAPSRRFLLK